MDEIPSSPGVEPSVDTVSITERRISGALEPKAMRVRLAMVGFHTLIFLVIHSPFSSRTCTVFLEAVITSIELFIQNRLVFTHF